MKRRNVILLVAALGAALVAATTWRGDATAPTDAPAWSVGDRAVYDLELTTRARVAVATGQALEGDVHVAGRLELRAYGQQGDAAQVELALAPSAVTMTAAGVDALDGDPAAAFGDARAYLTIAPGGEVTSVAFAPEARPAWKDLAVQLAGWLEVVVEPGASWSVSQVGPFGRGDVTYARDGATLTRRRARYTALDAAPGPVAGLRQRVDGQGTIVLAGRRVARMDEREAIAVARAAGGEVVSGEASLRLVLVESGRGRHAPPARLADRRRPGERVAAHDERALLADRVGELTPEMALGDLIAFGDIGLPDAGAWMWRATALLRLHPELCGKLRELAASGTLGPGGIALVADLLVSAQTPEAQAALRDVVVEAPATPRARVDLIQRLSLVAAPAPETITLARQLRDDARGRGDVDGARAAAYVVGNLAQTLRAEGDDTAAEALVAPLVEDLAHATDPDERVALAVAVGTAGLPEHEALLSELSADGDAGVRRAAVIGLARQVGDGARTALVEAAGDGDGAVTGAALRALADRDLDDGSLDALTARLAGGVEPQAQGELMRLLITQSERGADLTRLAPAIEATLARGGDPTIADALRRML